MKLILALCAAAVALADPHKDMWGAFKTKHGKTYSSEEEVQRFAVFKANIARAEMYNSMDDKATYSVVDSPFADLTEAEFKDTFLGLKAPSAEERAAMPELAAVETNSSVTVDWRSKGAVTPVKNQGQCGSCWAFSTTGNLEGVNFLKTGKLESFSEQQLVDCDKKTGDQGCQGGLPSNADKYIETAGLELESQYPYKGVNGACKASGPPAVKISNWTAISKDEDQIAAQLSQRGPLSIGINAGPMQLYAGGVACPWKLFCNPAKLDHGVLIVGNGHDEAKGDYWIIKNSWGTTWGEKGYYRICKGKGACGLNTMVTSAII